MLHNRRVEANTAPAKPCPNLSLDPTYPCENLNVLPPTPQLDSKLSGRLPRWMVIPGPTHSLSDIIILGSQPSLFILFGLHFRFHLGMYVFQG